MPSDTSTDSLLLCGPAGQFPYEDLLGRPSYEAVTFEEKVAGNFELRETVGAYIYDNTHQINHDDVPIMLDMATQNSTVAWSAHTSALSFFEPFLTDHNASERDELPANMFKGLLAKTARLRTRQELEIARSAEDPFLLELGRAMKKLTLNKEAMTETAMVEKERETNGRKEQGLERKEIEELTTAMRTRTVLGVIQFPKSKTTICTLKHNGITDSTLRGNTLSNHESLNDANSSDDLDLSSITTVSWSSEPNDTDVNVLPQL